MVNIVLPAAMAWWLHARRGPITLVIGARQVLNRRLAARKGARRLFAFASA